MKLYNKLFAGVLGMVVGASAITSCTDNIAFGNAFLEKPAGSTVTKDTVFNSAVYTEQFLNAIYALQYYGLPTTTIVVMRQVLGQVSSTRLPIAG